MGFPNVQATSAKILSLRSGVLMPEPYTKTAVSFFNRNTNAELPPTN